MSLLGRMREIEEIDFEWTENTFGYLSIPTFIIGVILFSFPDIVYKVFKYMQYRGLKPNSEFEDNEPKQEIPKLTEIIVKIIGMIMIIMGILWFWFSKEVYEFIF